MLATEWCAPNQGATVEDLLAVAPAHILTPEEFVQVRSRLTERTALRFVGGSLQAYDLERIRVSLGRLFNEPDKFLV